MKKLTDLRFDNSFERLGDAFFSTPAPAPFPDPYLVSFNAQAAALIGLDPEEAVRPEFLTLFTGQGVLEGMSPIATRYAGHQFGVFVPQLGDGRAMLLGEVQNDDGSVWELQLKGAGPTEFSRGADGRAVMRSSIREYLCSEALAGLGIGTTRALSLIGSDMPVYREVPETAAIVTRMAATFVRFGHFEVYYHRGQFPRVFALADYLLARHFQACREQPEPYLAMLEKIMDLTAEMIAGWQAVGFQHGVMNSDNMSVLGLTVDYGPFGFMEAFDPEWVCNHSDHRGRYAFFRQPQMAWWNLGCLAHGMLCLFDEDEQVASEKAKAVLDQFGERFGGYYAAKMQQKLGFVEKSANDGELLDELFKLMKASGLDYTQTFRRLSERDPQPQILRDDFVDRAAFDAWYGDYQQRLAQEGRSAAERSAAMKQVNPKFILRNYLAEIAIAKTVQNKDFSGVNDLLKVLQDPFAEHPEHEALAQLPPDWAAEIQVSCSS